MDELVVEINRDFVQFPTTSAYGKYYLMVTPPINEDYWALRVRLTDKQAIVAFPKFGTIGIGFQVEHDDWNTNLPYTCGVKQIYAHIVNNKGDFTIPPQRCYEAIELIQHTIRTIKEGKEKHEPTEISITT